MSSEKHQAYLSTHCRMCSQKLGRTQYSCAKYSTLLHNAGVDVTSDNSVVHPEHFCNSCYFTIKRICGSADKQRRTFRVQADWVPHSDDGLCSICDQKSKGGRPKKKGSSGRPTQLQQHLVSVASSAVPDFNLSQVIDEVSKANMTCSCCHLAANRPVEVLPCKSLVCYQCCVSLITTSEASFGCPGCLGRHEHAPCSFSKPSPIIERMLNEVTVRCELCNINVKLEILNNNCKYHAQSRQHLTLEDVVNHPLEATPSRLETQVAAKVVSRMLRQSDDGTVTLPTGGRVR